MATKKRNIKPITLAAEDVDGLFPAENAHVKAKELIKKSGMKMERIADCVGIKVRMLQVGLKDDRYPWIVLAVFKCLGYESRIVFEVKTPKEDDHEK